MATKLTERLVRSITPPTGKTAIHWDTEVRGFAVRVTPERTDTSGKVVGGTKSFILNYRTGGRERRITIGHFPEWSVAAARVEAKVMKRAVDGGADPMADRHAARGAPTVRDLYQRYCDEHLPLKSERAQADERAMWRNDILPELGSRRLADVARDEVQRLHAKITKSGRPVRANRLCEVLRRAFSLAVDDWKMAADNPASRFKRNPEGRREKYLSLEQVGRLARALAAHPERTSADAIRIMILTGARRGEVLRMRWDQVDFARGKWVKRPEETKQRRQHTVTLSAPALQLLSEVRERSKSKWVFPGPNGKPLTDVKRTWRSACREAGLVEVVGHRTTKRGERRPVSQPTVRLHDLRHTYASILASSGFSLKVIGHMLGHSRAETTNRYTHLFDELEREAAERVGAAVVGSEGGGTAEVVPLKKGG